MNDESRYLPLALLKQEDGTFVIDPGAEMRVETGDGSTPRVLEGDGYRITIQDDGFDDTLILSSGRSVYANCGIVGISPDGVVTEGYDGGLDPSGEGDFTEDERREIAAYMISRWREWGNL